MVKHAGTQFMFEQQELIQSATSMLRKGDFARCPF